MPREVKSYVVMNISGMRPCGIVMTAFWMSVLHVITLAQVALDVNCQH